MSSEPNCLVARGDLRARVRVGSVSGVGRVVVDRAVCDHALALVGSRRRPGVWGKKEGRGIR